MRGIRLSWSKRRAETIDIVREGRRDDGTWTLQNAYKGKTYFELERLGKPSRFNTLRALRVLKWWDRGRDAKDM